MSKQNYFLSTAFVASFALGFPQISLSQDAAADNSVMLCLDGSEPPCPDGEPAEGTVVPSADEPESVDEPAVEPMVDEEADVDAVVDPNATLAEEDAGVELEGAIEPETNDGQVEAEEPTVREPPATDSEETTNAPLDAEDPSENPASSAEQSMDESSIPPDAETSATAEVGSAPTAAASADDDAQPTDVTEETVSPDEARSSTQEFDTQIDATADTASANAAVSDESGEEDDGLSRFEQALLLGIGAVAVGSILNDGSEIVSNTGDRVVVDRNGQLVVYKDDNSLLFREGVTARTETFSDGSTRSFLSREDGSQIVTIRDAEGRVLRRTQVASDGTEVHLFDDTVEAEAVDVNRLATYTRVDGISFSTADDEALRAALQAENELDRRFSLRQIREYEEVRSLVPSIDLDTLNFSTGSAAIAEGQFEQFLGVGKAMEEMLDENPREVFLVEGHTDAVGDAASNLALSDRRAETVALALTEYFVIPAENLIVQGYGEQFLKVETEDEEQANRRATIRRITPLLQSATAD